MPEGIPFQSGGKMEMGIAMNARMNRVLRRAFLVIIDMIVCYCCWLFAAYTVDGNLAILQDNHLGLSLFIALQIVFLILFKIYNIRIIDSSLDLMVRGLGSMVFSGAIILVITLAHMGEFSYPFRIVFAYACYSILLLLGYRILYRLVNTYHFKIAGDNGNPRTIIYGAGEIGSQLARQHFKGKLPFSIVGFIDDDDMKQHSMVQGLPVMGTLDSLEAVLKESNATVIIIAITALSSNRMKKALDIAERYQVEVKIVPSLFEMEQGRKSIADIRSLDYNDLMGRSPVTIDREPIQQMVLGKKVLVTGAGGSIGSEICRQLLTYMPKQLLLLDIDETELHDLSLRLHNYQKEFSEDIMPIVCDVKDATKLERIFAQYEPDLVFHAAAYKHVPMMEYYPEEAIKTNIVGTYNVFSTAVRHHAQRCILISTDKAVNPTNVMGATKRVAELVASMLTTAETEIVCVRFGNVLGSRGSMLPLFLEQIREGLPITVTDKRIIRYFMTIPEAVGLVFLAGAMAKGGEVMVLDMGEQVNILEFAQRLLKHFGDGRSKIVITGLRPGEKLYEEKLSDKDHTMPTGNPKVFKAQVKGTLRKEDFPMRIETILTMDPQHLVEYLRETVPEFTYQGYVGK